MARSFYLLFLTAALVAQTAAPPKEAAEKAPPAKAAEPARPTSALAAVKRVYLLPMSSGLDQHLASEFTRQGVLEVVIDPKKADAVLTDRLGESFEIKVSELFATKKEEIKKSDSIRGPGISGKRNTGTVFLVDPKSMAVLWSAYQPPKDSSRDSLVLCARKIVDQFAAAKEPRKKKLWGVF
jgi:hypothetical protein